MSTEKKTSKHEPRTAAHRAKRAQARRKRLLETEYVFGLAFPPTSGWLQIQWKNRQSDDRDEFVRQFLMQPGPHLLPLVDGNSADLEMVRRRHLENLLVAFGEAEVSRLLRVELDEFLAVETVTINQGET